LYGGKGVLTNKGIPLLCSGELELMDITKSPVKAVCIFLSILCGLVCVSYEASAGSVLVSGQKLTIHAKNTPLREILQTVSQQANILIVYYGTTDKPVNIDLNSMPLEEGLKKVLSGSNFSFLYKKSNDPGSADNIVLSKITIISGSSSDAPVRFGAQPVEPVTPTPLSNIPVIAPVATPVAQIENEKDNSGRPNEGISLSQADSDSLKQMSKEEMMSQIQGKETDIIPGIAGNPGNAAGLPEKSKGFQITGVTNRSFFSNIGLKSGDIIHNVNGRTVSSSEQLVAVIQNSLKGPGSAAPIRIDVDPGTQSNTSKSDNGAGKNSPNPSQAIYVYPPRTMN
jgi:hypothetical protein